MCRCLFFAIAAYVAWSERPPDHHVGAEVHRHPSRHAKEGAQSLQVTSLMALVSEKVGNHSELAETVATMDPSDTETSNEPNDGEQSSSNQENDTQSGEKQKPTGGKMKSTASNDAEVAKPNTKKNTESSQESGKANKVEQEAKQEESLKETDEKKVLSLIPGIAEWEKTVLKKFKENEGSQCVSVKDDLKYGCAWTPRERSGMSEKDQALPLCTCGSTFGFQQCWHPDADEVMTFISAKDNARAFEVGKAYLAGMCYTPIWIWVVLGILIFCLLCGGGWSWTLRKKGEDSRLVGSTRDPARARNLGS